MRRIPLLAIVVGVVAVVLLVRGSVFIVDEREKALVLQFGQIQRVEEDPGLAFKIPLIQQVVRYDDRILSLDTDPIEVTPSDDRRLVVDAFARYRILDVVQFRQAVGVGGVQTAEDRLESILRAQTRAVLGADGVTSNTILSSDRAILMNRIRDRSRTSAEGLGLQVVDVRLKQTALPEQNLEATFARMRAEREREAADEIARGNEAAQRVRALADRTSVELVSEAQREAEITRGEADAERNAIFADAFGSDPSFFEFYRSLTAYQRALREGGTTMVMSPDSEFFDYLRTDGRVTGGEELIGTGATGGGAAPAQEEAPEPEAAPEATEEAPVEEEDSAALAPEAESGADAADAPGGGDAAEAVSGGDAVEAVSGGDAVEAVSGGDAVEAVSGGGAAEAQDAEDVVAAEGDGAETLTPEASAEDGVTVFTTAED